MRIQKKKLATMLAGAVLALSLMPAAAQATKIMRTETRTAEASSTDALADTQQKLLQFLRETPTVAGAVARDPSLLGDQPYIQRSNPKLAEFLAAHPEVARNPEYYLFTNLPSANGSRERALQHELWPQYLHGESDQKNPMDVMGPIAAVCIVAVMFGAGVWVIKLFVEGRRQGRRLKMLNDLQSRLIDKLGSSEELVAYLNSEAGQKLLTGNVEALHAPAPALSFTMERVARPLQIGAILIVVSCGVYMLQTCGLSGQAYAVVASTTHALSILLFTAGIGFILSAGIAWAMAKKMGALPLQPEAPATPTDDRP